MHFHVHCMYFYVRGQLRAHKNAPEIARTQKSMHVKMHTAIHCMDAKMHVLTAHACKRVYGCMDGGVHE